MYRSQFLMVCLGMILILTLISGCDPLTLSVTLSSEAPQESNLPVEIIEIPSDPEAEDHDSVPDNDVVFITDDYPLHPLTFDYRPGWADELEAILNERLEQERLSHPAEEVPRMTLLYYEPEMGRGYAYGDIEGAYGAGSTIKVPMAIGIGDLIEAGELTLDSIVYYIPELDSDPYGVNFITYDERINGLTIHSLLYYMIAYSCNASMNIVDRITDFAGHHPYMARLGYPMEIPDNNRVTARQFFMVLYDLYLHRDKPFYDLLLNMMNDSRNTYGLARYLPDNLFAARKSGNIVHYNHETGIFFAPEPYILLVYTAWFEYSTDLMADVSLLIYEHNGKE